MNYPPLNMHFVVKFKHKEFSKDIHFQSVNGLKASICKSEESKLEKVHFENLVLKRAYEPDSRLIAWCMNRINNHKTQAVNLVISLLNSEHKMLSGWIIEKAIPVSWSVEELHAQETRILIERIELEYDFFEVLNSQGKIIAPKEKKRIRK